MLLRDAAATEAIGGMLAALVRAGDVVTLTGPLGSGKTTIARGLLAGLGLTGDVPSPTFAVILPYAPPEVRLPVWHADLYRLREPDELEELGLEDAGEGLLLVEWPEIAGAQAWPHALALSLTPPEAGAELDGRRLTWTAGAAWHGRWPPFPSPSPAPPASYQP